MTTPDSPTPATGLTVFIGGGNMARALIAGLIRQGEAPACIAVAEPVIEAREALARDFGIEVGEDGIALLDRAQTVVLAVKPQVMEGVCRSLATGLQPGTVVLSVAAGIPCARLAEWLGSRSVVRAMPNTPALLGAGATGLYAPPELEASARERAEAVLAGSGLCVWIDDEAQMDVVTALSGSGPAYFFLMVEALVEAAVAQGLPRGAAEALARQTALGAARMLVETGESAAELRRRVTSPGGTTHAAISRFQADGFEAGVAAAIGAAVQRGRALASG
jgi:pyrroline-5-carboxylate reductase